MVIKIKDSDKLSTNMIMNIRVQYLIKKKRVHLIIKYCILLIIGMLNCFMYQKLSSVMFVLDSNSVFSTISITVSLTAFAFSYLIYQYQIIDLLDKELYELCTDLYKKDALYSNGEEFYLKRILDIKVKKDKK